MSFIATCTVHASLSSVSAIIAVQQLLLSQFNHYFPPSGAISTQQSTLVEQNEQHVPCSTVLCSAHIIHSWLKTILQCEIIAHSLDHLFLSLIQWHSIMPVGLLYLHLTNIFHDGRVREIWPSTVSFRCSENEWWYQHDSNSILNDIK